MESDVIQRYLPLVRMCLLLIITGIIGLVVTLMPPSAPSAILNTPALSPTQSPIPTHTPTATSAPTLLPPVTPEEPENGSYIDSGSEATLRWSFPFTLQTGDYYRLTIQTDRGNSIVFSQKEDNFRLSALSPGQYRWAVAVVRSTVSGEVELLSKESSWYSFEIVLPSPVVHSVSPTCTVRGSGVTVVVNGENFPPSPTIKIGVPLQATFVNSRTIMATIPPTLEVGDYPVIVEDSTGGGVSYAYFLVSEPPSTPTPLLSAWDPATPMPTARPGYDPNTECVVDPCLPAPQLAEPQDGAVFALSSRIELEWTWAYCLPPGWLFAIRISDSYPPHSYRYEGNPALISCEDGKAVGRYLLDKESRFTMEPGGYYWNIAVARSVAEAWQWERLSGDSETRTFIVEPGEIEGPTPAD